MHKIKFLLLLLVLAALSIAAVGCGSSNGDESVADSVVEPEIDAVQITLPDGVFTPDDVAVVGWKKSKRTFA